MLQTWNLLFYVARLRKKKDFMENFGEIFETINVTKLKYLITAWLHSNNSLQREHARRKLVFTVAVLLKGNRSSFSKQLGINCTCEQIGLFLISTRGCGSHSWKLLKSPICSRVQLIPNCFSNRPISYTNCLHTFLTAIRKLFEQLSRGDHFVNSHIMTCVMEYELIF